MSIKSIVKVFREIWPKLLIFTVMLVITIFQKHPMTFKGLGQSESEIAEQFRTGEFKTTEFETKYLAYVQIEKILFTVGVFFVFLWFRRKNQQYEKEQISKYQEQQKQISQKETDEINEEFEFTTEDIKFYREFDQKQKSKESEKRMNKEKLLKGKQQTQPNHKKDKHKSE